MRVFKINADEQAIEILDDIETDDGGYTLDCETCCKLIGNGCDVIVCVSLDEGGVLDMIYDNEGRLRGSDTVARGFRFKGLGIEIAGNAIITMVDNGEWVSFPNTPETITAESDLLDLLEDQVEWLDLKQHPLDPHVVSSHFDIIPF